MIFHATVLSNCHDLLHRSDGIAGVSPMGTTVAPREATVSPEIHAQTSSRALASGIHCIVMKSGSKSPNTLTFDRPTRLHLPDYTLAQLVGEVRVCLARKRLEQCVSCPLMTQTLGYPNPLDDGTYGFGPYAIPASQVFFTTRHSLAIVNIRPVIPGALPIIPSSVQF